MDTAELQDLVGRTVVVDVDEGGGILGSPGLELHGEIVAAQSFPYPPSVGRPGTYESLELRLVKPEDERFKDCRLFISLRHENTTFWASLDGQVVIVNIQLYGPDGKLNAGGIGSLRPLRTPPTREEYERRSGERRVSELERVALAVGYAEALKSEAKDRLAAIASDAAQPEWLRQRAREAHRRVEEALRTR